MFRDDRHKADLRHECELTIKDDVTHRHIDHGLFVDFRRWFRKLMMLDEFNPRSRSFYKSTYIMSREKIFHLNFYYYMIHPFCAFREFWEILQIISIIIKLTMIPFDMLIVYDGLRTAALFMDIMTILDIIVTFNTGFVHSHANCVILNRRLVAKHYIFSTFICDVLSFVNLSYITIIFNGKITMYKYMEFINVATWLRFFVMWMYLNRLKDARQINMFAIGVIKLILTITLLVFWMTALTYVASFDTDIKEDHSPRNLDESVRSSFLMLFLVGPSVPPVDIGLLISQMLCLLVGFILNMLFLCYIMQSGTKYNSSRKFNQSVKQLNDYMRHKSLAPALQAKILKYYDFRYQMSHYQEDYIMKILGPQLQQEVMLQAHMHFFTKFPLFEIIPLHVLFGVMMKMKIMCYMPSDTIISTGQKNKAMYFINYGSVAIYTISGKELMHLAEGEHFGEMALMGDTRYNSDTIIAIDCCEIFVLKRKYFMAEIEQYPDVYPKVTKYMSDFVAKYYNEDAEMDDGLATTGTNRNSTESL